MHVRFSVLATAILQETREPRNQPQVVLLQSRVQTLLSPSMCCVREQVVSHSSTEAEIVALDVALRTEGLPMLTLWESTLRVMSPGPAFSGAGAPEPPDRTWPRLRRVHLRRACPVARPLRRNRHSQRGSGETPTIPLQCMGETPASTATVQQPLWVKRFT